MTDAFWTTAFAIGLAQGGFLVGVLLLRRGTRPTATRTLALIVAVFTLMILAGAGGPRLEPPLARLAACLNINTELALGPLFLLFVRSLLDPQRRWSRSDLVHFLPLVAGWVGWSALWIATPGQRHVPSLFDLQGVVRPYMVFKLLFLMTYLFLTYRALARGLDGPQRLLAGRQDVDLRWLARWIVVLGLFGGACYLADFADRLGLSLGFEPDQLTGFLMAVMIYLASMLVFLRPWVLSLSRRRAAPQRSDPEVSRLEAYLARERPWLDPALRLDDLAKALSSTENRLSAVINEGLGTNFYGLLNRYRLREFDRLVRDPAREDRSCLELAYDAGFNSKASFYRAFREAHGTTPNAYRAAISGLREENRSHRAQ